MRLLTWWQRCESGGHRLHRLLLAWLRQDIGSATVILPSVLQTVAAAPPSDAADAQAWGLVAAALATAANAGPVAAPLLRQVLQSEVPCGRCDGTQGQGRA